jgi:hypothetical protein
MDWLMFSASVGVMLSGVPDSIFSRNSNRPSTATACNCCAI